MDNKDSNDHPMMVEAERLAKQLMEEGGLAALQAERDRILKKNGVTDNELAEFSLIKKCYEEVARNDLSPPELVRVSDNALHMFMAFMAREAREYKDDASAGNFEDSFAMAVLIGMAIGIELQERRHA